MNYIDKAIIMDDRYQNNRRMTKMTVVWPKCPLFDIKILNNGHFDDINKYIGHFVYTMAIWSSDAHFGHETVISVSHSKFGLVEIYPHVFIWVEKFSTELPGSNPRNFEN